VLPLLGNQLGVDFNVISRGLRIATSAIVSVIVYLTGNA